MNSQFILIFSEIEQYLLTGIGLVRCGSKVWNVNHEKQEMCARIWPFSLSPNHSTDTFTANAVMCHFLQFIALSFLQYVYLISQFNVFSFDLTWLLLVSNINFWQKYIVYQVFLVIFDLKWFGLLGVWGFEEGCVWNLN